MHLLRCNPCKGQPAFPANYALQLHASGHAELASN
jgi:hypothetical protein